MILQIGLIEDGKSITGDSWALDLARDIETSALTTLAEVVSFFGRLYVVDDRRCCATALALLIKRRVWEAATLVAGLDRDRGVRPGDQGGGGAGAARLTGWSSANGFAYPSAHAAVAVSYLAISVAVARLVSLPYRLALVLTGLGMAIAIGVSRVYLRVHYLSDVGGGWAVGLAAYSGCAIVAHAGRLPARCVLRPGALAGGRGRRRIAPCGRLASAPWTASPPRT